jgi:hypothetical protein
LITVDVPVCAAGGAGQTAERAGAADVRAAAELNALYWAGYWCAAPHASTIMGLGFDMTVHRQQGDGTEQAHFGAPRGTSIATWEAESLEWIEEPVKEGKVLDLDGQGYSCEFTAMATT